MTDAKNPVDTLQDTPAKTRKPRKVDQYGTRLVKHVFYVSTAQENDLLKALAAFAGQRFTKEYIFGGAGKDSWMINEIVNLAKSWLADNADETQESTN